MGCHLLFPYTRSVSIFGLPQSYVSRLELVFFPIDILVSFTGITSLYLMNRKRQIWRYFAIISLTLTHASGLIAISFWTMQEWFDLSWWIPNLYLLLYPIPMIIYLLKEKDAA